MKKIFFIMVFVAIIFPASLFAEPTDEEISEVVGQVFALYMVNLFSVSLAGNTETVQLKEHKDGKTEMIFKNFDAKKMGSSLGDMFNQNSTKEKENEFNFEKISGKITVYGNMKDPDSFLIDVSLTKCSVKTLWLKMNEKNEEFQLKVNGKHCKDTEKLFKGAEMFNE